MNVTYGAMSKFAGLHYSWKYHRRNVNSFYCNYILIVSRINRSHQSRTLTFQKIFVICFIQSSLKMKNFKNQKSKNFISKIMTSQPGQQTITIHILPNISQYIFISKDNQTMKLGQLIEYIKRNIFSSKIMQKIRQGTQFHTSFCFLKKINIR